MKAVLALALATTAQALLGCQIPTTYAAGTTTCSGPVTGYVVYGVCLTGLTRDTAIYAAPAAGTVIREKLTTTNTASFTGAAGGVTATGCAVPDSAQSWNAAGSTAAPIIAAPVATACTVNGGTYAIANSVLKGVEVRCDNTNGYWPQAGFEGTAICADAAAVAPFPARVLTPVNDYWFSSSTLQSLDSASTKTEAQQTMTFQITAAGVGNLVCTKQCVLPASVCSNNALMSNIIGYGHIAGSCNVKPTNADWDAAMGTTSGFRFWCANTAAWENQVYLMQCKADGTWTETPTYSTFDYCGGTTTTQDGAITTFVYNRGGEINNWSSATQNANAIFGYPTVTSTLKLVYTKTKAYSQKREWNNMAMANFVDGSVYRVDITGCSTITAAADRTTCVQRTLNWWRCYYDFPFNGATVCYSNNVAIACPSSSLGYNCPSSSKKGLLGLLGLLILIPIFLILCCLLLLCCLRRRKTEADVHFATFDPHAAPVMGTAHCAPMTACAGSFAPATMPVM